MKKRAAAAILGILLSVSMGLEVPAAALDGGFTSGFTSEQTGEAQQPDAVEAEQPAVSEPETPSVDGSQQETSDTVQTPQENVSAGESVTVALHLEARRTETEPVQRILYRMCRDLRTRMRQILLKCRRHRKRLLICGPVNPAPFLNGRNGSRHQTADSGSIKRKL